MKMKVRLYLVRDLSVRSTLSGLFMCRSTLLLLVMISSKTRFLRVLLVAIFPMNDPSCTGMTFPQHSKC